MFRGTTARGLVSRIVVAVALVALVLVGAGCTTLSMRPDADLLHLGVLAHHGGEAVDVGVLYITGSNSPTVQWVATPFSVRLQLSVPNVNQAPSAAPRPAVLAQPIVQAWEQFPALAPGERLKAIDSNGPYAAATSGRAAYLFAGIEDDTPYVSVAGMTAGNDVLMNSESGCLYVADGSSGVRVISSENYPTLEVTQTVAVGGDATAITTALNTLFVANGDEVVALDASVPTSVSITADTSESGYTADRVACRAEGTSTVDVFASGGGRITWYRYDVAAKSFALVHTYTMLDDLIDIAAPEGNAHIWAVGATRTYCFDTAGDQIALLGTSDCVGTPMRLAGTSGDIRTSPRLKKMLSTAAKRLPMPAPRRVPIQYLTEVVAAEGHGGAVSYGTPDGVRVVDTAQAADDSTDVAVSMGPNGSVIWVADGEQGIDIYTWFVEQTALLGHFWRNTDFEDARAIDVAGTTFFVGDGETLRAFDASMSPMGTEVATAAIGAAVEKIDSTESTAYVASDAGLTIVDISTGTTPTVYGPFAASGAGRSVVLNAGFAYVGTANGKVDVFDISDPAAAHRDRTVSLTGNVRDLEVADGRLYAAAGKFAILNVATAGNPTVMSQTTTVGTPRGVGVDAGNDTVYVVTGGGTEAYDVANGAAPRNIGHYRSMSAVGMTMLDTGSPSRIFVGSRIARENPAQPVPLVVGGPQGLYMLTQYVAPSQVRAGIEGVADGAAYLSTVTPAAYAAVDTSAGAISSLAYASGCSVTMNGSTWLGTQSWPSVSSVTTSGPVGTPGAYSLKAFASDIAGHEASVSADFRIITDQRIDGPDRYGTANTLSESSFTTATTVFIATGHNYPDALCGAPLAAALRAPLLLVNGSVSASTAAEIQRLGATRAIILGGESAVSTAIPAQLASAGIDPDQIERIGGADRYATSALIATRLRATVGQSSAVFIATGRQFPDALSGSGIASWLGSPILLCGKKGIDPDTQALLNSWNPAETIVLGGTGAVPNGLRLPGRVTRLGGRDRYQTASIVASWALSRGFASTNVYLASGLDFPDALCAAEPCARDRAVLVLASGSLPAYTRDWLRANRGGIINVHTVGGDAAVSETVHQAALQAVGLAPVPAMGEPRR